MPDGRGPSTYHLDAAVVLRVAGSLLVVLGLACLVVALTVGSSPLLLVLAALTVLLVMAGAVATLRPPRILTLSDRGFQVSLVRGAGTTSGQWDDVESVDSGVVRGTAAIVLALSGGRSTVVPLSLLGRRNVEAQRDIHNRLNDAYGYRHLDSA
ncbi:MAG: hypothetical protein QOK30_1868 [Nocardioidaceae bacterium]|nr:hypothetical protein [Nocardioidaceae bacterium]